MADNLNAEAVIAIVDLIENESSDSSSSSSGSSSESEVDFNEFINLRALVQQDLVGKRNTIKNFCEEVVPAYTNREFISHFRIGRGLMESLAEQFAASDTYQALVTPASSHTSISAEKHLLTFLWFAGHQTASFRDVADRFDVSISSLHDITTRVIQFLSGLAAKIIAWPNADQKASTMEHFFVTKDFPNIIGSIDGCHIRLDKPSLNGNDYINRHNYPSMVLQGVCNEQRKFIDIFIGYPGSVHDARIFENSTIHGSIQDLCEGGFLLGDRAYPNLDVLITPYRDNGHLNEAQRNFNVKLSSCRIIIEHTFGILKQRFRQLYHLKLKGHERISHFIRACCVLHNIADMDELDVFENEENPEENQPHQDFHGAGALVSGNNRRDRIARQLFER